MNEQQQRQKALAVMPEMVGERFAACKPARAGGVALDRVHVREEAVKWSETLRRPVDSALGGIWVAEVGGNRLIVESFVTAPDEILFVEGLTNQSKGGVRLVRTVAWMPSHFPNCYIFKAGEKPLEEAKKWTINSLNFMLFKRARSVGAKLAKSISWQTVRRCAYVATILPSADASVPYAAVELSIGVWRYAQGCFAWRLLSRPQGADDDAWELVADSSRTFESGSDAQADAVSVAGNYLVLNSPFDTQNIMESGHEYTKDQRLMSHLRRWDELYHHPPVVNVAYPPYAPAEQLVFERFEGLVNWHNGYCAWGACPPPELYDKSVLKEIAGMVEPLDLPAVADSLRRLHGSPDLKRTSTGGALSVAEAFVGMLTRDNMEELLNYFKRHHIYLYVEAMRLLGEERGALDDIHVYTQVYRKHLAKIVWLVLEYGIHYKSGRS